jgi:hypothetical protein
VPEIGIEDPIVEVYVEFVERCIDWVDRLRPDREAD